MILQDIKQGGRLEGAIPNEIVQTVSIQPFGEDAVDGNKGAVACFANRIDRGPGFAETKRSLNLQKLRTAARVAVEKELMV